MMNNPFLSTVKRMFGRHRRTYASASCFTPQTEGEKFLAPALGKMQRICTFIPGGRFCIDVEEGRMVIAVAWTPRANESKHFGKHRFVIDATGGHEVDAGAKPVRREEAPESSSKTSGMIRRVTDYLTSRYYFRFNVLTEQTEYAERAEEATTHHLTYIYRKVDKRVLNALFYKHVPEEELFNSVFRFATADDKEEDIRQLNAARIFEAMKQAHPAAMRGMTAYSLSRVLPQLGERVHTVKGECVPGGGSVIV